MLLKAMLTLPTFRFDDVLYALDMKAPTLRRWLQFGLIGDTAKSKARASWALEFTPFDMAVLALVKPMTEFGVPVTLAHEIAVREMREHAGPWSDEEPLNAYWTAWSRRQLSITPIIREEDGKRFWESRLWENVDDPEHWSAYLSLNPEILIRNAIERALVSAAARERRSA
jgi:hypothetical protein